MTPHQKPLLQSCQPAADQGARGSMNNAAKSGVNSPSRDGSGILDGAAEPPQDLRFSPFPVPHDDSRQPTSRLCIHYVGSNAHLPIRPLAIVCGGSKDSVSEFKAGVCPTGALVRRPPALVPSAPPAGTLLPPLLPPPRPLIASRRPTGNTAPRQQTA